MARYVARIRSPRPPDEAFAYMADLANFAEWDPGVIEVTQAEGDGPGPGAAYDVTVKGVPSPLVLRYHLTEYNAPTDVVARAESKTLVSLDRITVSPDDDGGSIVVYDAELTLKGFLRLADPMLGLVFNRIGDRAAEGMATALAGRRIEVAG